MSSQTLISACLTVPVVVFLAFASILQESAPWAESADEEWIVYEVGHAETDGAGQLPWGRRARKVLPLGVRNVRELDKHLKTYFANGQLIQAGFIPSSTTIVDGEPILLTFVVRNTGKTRFTFEFGGDYRFVDRHNRFEIKIRDSRGESLPDPSKYGDFGGLISERQAAPGWLSTERLDLAKYRTIPGPGRYTIFARYVLYDDESPMRQKFRIPVETTYQLVILPRSSEDLDRVKKASLRPRG